MRTVLAVGLVTLLLLPLACGVDSEIEPVPSPGSDSAIDHFAWISETIARGAQPKADAAFRQLAEAGIRTIISVDGAKPDLAAARKHGLRYVHIPFGYDGVPREQQLALAKTVRELKGPFFIHCHHGKHRGPAGAVLAQMALGGMTPEQAVAEMKRAGAADYYTGLYACAQEYVAPTDSATGAHDFAFPSTAPVPAMAGAMATIDRRWDGMKLVKGSGWKAPEGHADIAPAHEALQLEELFTELGRTDDVKGRPEDFRKWLEESRVAAKKLRVALASEPVDAASAAEAFGAIKANCRACHGSYRNRKR
jgi:protein tyrosine phosphatase (PTP) superfamily phosphohydrolase (DUF442 family)